MQDEKVWDQIPGRGCRFSIVGYENKLESDPTRSMRDEQGGWVSSLFFNHRRVSRLRPSLKDVGDQFLTDISLHICLVPVEFTWYSTETTSDIAKRYIR